MTAVPTELPANHLNEARRRAYLFFSDLAERGLQPSLMDVVRTSPELSPHVADPIDFDEAAADHFELLDNQVHPYQGVFTNPRVELENHRLAAVYQLQGFECADGLSADHLATQLRFLAATSTPAEFLDQEILNWLPALRIAVHREDSAFYGAALDLLWDIVLEHAEELGASSSDTQPCEVDSLDWLAHKDTSMRDISAYLLSPARCGLYLSRTAISRIGGDLPRGFGSRSLELRNLLSSAIDYDAMVNIVDGLEQEFAAWTDAFRLDAERSALAQRVSSPWLQRLSNASKFLSKLRLAS